MTSERAVDSGPHAGTLRAVVDPEKLTGAISRSSRVWSMKAIEEWPRVITDHAIAGLHPM
jgi:hypothetical protein